MMVHKVVGCPGWSGWQWNQSGILPQKRGRQLHWPTVVLNGGLVDRLKDPFALSPFVLKGFQSSRAITMVNLEEDQVNDYQVETLGGREFILTLPDRQGSAFMRDTRRGLADIAAGNRANFLLFLQDVRHTMKNEISPIILSLCIFKKQEKIPIFEEGLNILCQPPDIQVKMRPLDDLVEEALNGLRQINNACKNTAKLFSRLDASEFVTNGKRVTVDDFYEVLEIFHKAQKQLPQKIGRIEQEFIDLGRLNLTESTTLNKIDNLRLAAAVYPTEADDLMGIKIMGNETILREVFAEIFRNARRAAGVHEAEKSDLINIKLQRVEDKNMLEVKAINKVTCSKAKSYLQENADYLFEEHDDQDGHGKQRIFKMGVSSRQEGGTGLALLWEYVVLKLKGEIHADYVPRENEYSIAVSFRISK